MLNDIQNKHKSYFFDTYMQQLDIFKNLNVQLKLNDSIQDEEQLYVVSLTGGTAGQSLYFTVQGSSIPAFQFQIKQDGSFVSDTPQYLDLNNCYAQLTAQIPTLTGVENRLLPQAISTISDGVVITLNNTVEITLSDSDCLLPGNNVDVTLNGNDIQFLVSAGAGIGRELNTESDSQWLGLIDMNGQSGDIKILVSSGLYLQEQLTDNNQKLVISISKAGQ